MATQLDDRQVVNRAALSALGNTANSTLDVLMSDINALFAAATYIPTASVLMTRDANANTQANSFLAGFATTATSAATTTLTVASKAFQQFTGTNTQTVVLPAATTLTQGQSFTITNRSTGNVTVQTNGGASLQVLTANSQAVFTVTNIGTSAGTWDVSYTVTGAPTFLQTQVTTDSTTTGSAATLQTGDIVFGDVRLTNTSLVSVSGIPAGASGQQIIVENQTGNTITINNNDSGATAANRIYTGTGASVTMAANASFEFVYDSTTARWMLVGGTGSGSGSGGSKNYLTTYTASTASGVPNTGNGNFELGSTAGWNLTHSSLSSGTPTAVATAGNAFLTGSGGTGNSGTLSITTVSSSQLSGSYSGNLASSGASTAGDMLISNAFFIDTSDQNNIMSISFDYKVVSGTLNMSGTSSNSFTIWVYDVTNAAWIQPQGVYAMVQTSGVGKAYATFQSTANSTKYQIALINANTISAAYSLYIDDFSVGPVTGNNGIINQAVTTTTLSAGSSGTYTPPAGCYMIEVEVQGAGGSGGGTPGTNSTQNSVGSGGGAGGFARKIINLATAGATSFSYSVANGAAGAANSSASANATTFSGGTISITANGGAGGASGATETGGPIFPAGAGGTGGTASGGDLNIQGGQGGTGFVLAIGQLAQGPGGSSFMGMGEQGPNNESAQAGQSYGAGGTGAIAAINTAAQAGGSGGGGLIIIREYYYGQNVQISSQSATNGPVLCSATGSTATGTINSSSTLYPIIFAIPQVDTYSGYNASSGFYTVPVSGYYLFTVSVQITSTTITAWQVNLLKNSQTFAVTAPTQASASRLLATVSAIILCNAGDTLSAQSDNFIGTGTPSFQAGCSNMSIALINSGTQTLASTATVAAYYHDTSGGSIGTGATAYSYGTKQFDTHNAYSGSTFTAPISGKYMIAAGLGTAAVNLSTSNIFAVWTVKNGSARVWTQQTQGSGTSTNYVQNGSGIIQLNAGDTLQIFCQSSVATTGNTLDGVNTLSIFRIGN